MSTQRLYRRLSETPHLVKLLEASITGYRPSGDMGAFVTQLDMLKSLKSPSVMEARLPSIDSEQLKHILSRKNQLESDIELLQAEVSVAVAAAVVAAQSAGTAIVSVETTSWRCLQLGETQRKRASEGQTLDNEIKKLTDGRAFTAVLRRLRAAVA